MVEVLSPSTADYDRGEKLEHYRRVPSLEAVVLVDHEEARLDLWSRREGGWESERFGEGEALALEPIECRLEVDAIYRAGREA